MAVGSHPFPFRTRKLSPPAPMVLGDSSPGRVGRRRFRSREAPRKGGFFRVSSLRAPGFDTRAGVTPLRGPLACADGTATRRPGISPAEGRREARVQAAGVALRSPTRKGQGAAGLEREGATGTEGQAGAAGPGTRA